MQIKKGSSSPGGRTLPMEGAVSGRTVAGMPFSDRKMLPPPLPEAIIKMGAIERQAAKTETDYQFKIELTNLHSLLIMEKLGEGGMGIVYRAVHEFKKGDGVERGGFVAVKLIHFDPAMLGSDPEKRRKDLCESFISEVQLATKLSHDNIIRIFVFGETDEAPGNPNRVPFYAMELLKGSDLHELMREENQMPWGRVSFIMEQVCSALSAAHEYEEDGKPIPIIHRDIKPMNIFITQDSDGNDKMKILDFGLAKILTPAKPGVKKNEGLWGTPDYMPPEQAQCMEVDHRSDIYAVGAVMYHLLSGNPPFKFTIPENPGEFSGEWAKYLERLLEEKPQPLAGAGIEISTEAEGIIMKCLEKDPLKRYQSARELREDLKKCNAEEKRNARVGFARDAQREVKGVADAADSAGYAGAQTMEIEIIEHPKPSKGSSLFLKKLMYGAIGLSALAAVSGGFFALKNKNEPEPHSTIPRVAITRDAFTFPKKSDSGPASKPAMDSGVLPSLDAGSEIKPDAQKTVKPKIHKRIRRKVEQKKKKFLIDSE